MTALFFKDRRACIRYFSSLDFLISPTALKFIFTAQERGFRMTDIFPAGAVQTGYLTENDIILVPMYSDYVGGIQNDPPVCNADVDTMKTPLIPQFQDFPGLIIHWDGVHVVRINFKLSLNNSVFSNFSKRIGQNRSVNEMKLRELETGRRTRNAEE